MDIINIFLLYLALVSWPAVHSLSLHQRDVPAVVSFPIQRGERKSVGPYKRSSTALVPVWNENLDLSYPFYVCNISLGTPPQTVQVNLDTRYGYLTVSAANSSWCLSYDEPSCVGPGSFHVNESSTYKVINHDFRVKYELERTASGDLVTDTLTVNGATVSNMPFGITYAIAHKNVLGLGYIIGKDPNFYKSVPQALTDSGQINSPAYSLWMDSPAGRTGRLLFGGINTAKYIGELHTMPIPAVDGVHYLPSVLATGVGTYKTYLPDKVVDAIYKDLGAYWVDIGQMAAINCSKKQEDYTLTFNLSGFEMQLPVRDLIIGDGRACFLSLCPCLGQPAVLGNSFMIGAYVVVDFANNEISMARTNFSPGEDHILEIGNGSHPIPDAVSIAVTATAPIPTTVSEPPYTRRFTPASASTTSHCTTSNVAVRLSTSKSNNLMAGIVGAGIAFGL